MRFFGGYKDLLELLLEYKAQSATLEVRLAQCEKNLEEMRMRMSAPQGEAPVKYKDSDWLELRRKLEGQYAEKGESNAKQRPVA